ncbi:MAG: hypothetical protein AB7U73_02210, partial [Pirellulales bacterium]
MTSSAATDLITSRGAEPRPGGDRSSSARTWHICHLVHGLTVGGAERLALRMGDHLPADKYQVSYLCLDVLGTWGTELRDSGGRVHLIGRRPGFDWGC